MPSPVLTTKFGITGPLAAVTWPAFSGDPERVTDLELVESPAQAATRSRAAHYCWQDKRDSKPSSQLEHAPNIYTFSCAIYVTWNFRQLMATFVNR